MVVTSEAAAAPARELVEVLGAVPRALRRRVREEWPLEPLPTAQLELVRAIRHRPGMTVGQAASELRIAPNTASTLVNRLAAAGLVDRRPDERDRRAVRLHLTASAERRIRAWRDRRADVLHGAFAALDAADRDRIAAALPALRRLHEALEHER